MQNSSNPARISRPSNMRTVIDDQPRGKHDARGRDTRPFDQYDILYDRKVYWYSPDALHGCGTDAVSRYRACYC